MSDKIKKNTQKPSINISELPKRQAALVLLTDNGLRNKDAAKIVGYKESSANQTLSKLRKYTFTGNKKAQKTAFKTINSLAAGQIPKDSQIEEVKDSTAFNASKYISEHNDPVVNMSKNLNINIDLDPVDMEKYK
jgi:transposase